MGRSSRAEGRDASGQAAVELVAAIPTLLILGLGCLQLALVGFSAWSAASAARAVTRAGLLGAGPDEVESAARAALPAPWRDGVEVELGAEMATVSVAGTSGAPLPAAIACSLQRRRARTDRHPSGDAHGNNPGAGTLRANLNRVDARERRAEAGQAHLELVAGVPLLLVVGALLVQMLAIGYTQSLADGAAEAATIALVNDLDPGEAARASLPGWASDRLEVDRAAGGRVELTLRAPRLLPGLGSTLEVNGDAWVRAPGIG